MGVITFDLVVTTAFSAIVSQYYQPFYFYALLVYGLAGFGKADIHNRCLIIAPIILFAGDVTNSIFTAAVSVKPNFSGMWVQSITNGLYTIGEIVCEFYLPYKTDIISQKPVETKQFQKTYPNVFVWTAYLALVGVKIYRIAIPFHFWWMGVKSSDYQFLFNYSHVNAIIFATSSLLYIVCGVVLSSQQSFFTLSTYKKYFLVRIAMALTLNLLSCIYLFSRPCVASDNTTCFIYSGVTVMDLQFYYLDFILKNDMFLKNDTMETRSNKSKVKSLQIASRGSSKI